MLPGHGHCFGDTEALDNRDNAVRVGGAHRTAASGGQETDAEAKG
ncbi:MAG: hypothetical protein ACKV2V_08695 [Blastocatellia bacterium]